MIQIRNVPTDLHRRLKARAALEGMSLSDYLLREIRQAAERPTIDDLRDMAITRYPHDVLLYRAWELRTNLTAYDAVYVALAEALDATLLTCDQKIASVPGVTVAVDLVN